MTNDHETRLIVMAVMMWLSLLTLALAGGIVPEGEERSRPGRVLLLISAMLALGTLTTLAVDASLGPYPCNSEKPHHAP